MLDNQFFPGAGGERSLSLVIVARLFEPARGTVKYIHTHKINEKRVSLMYSIYSINKRISMQSRLCLSLFLIACYGEIFSRSCFPYPQYTKNEMRNSAIYLSTIGREFCYACNSH